MEFVTAALESPYKPLLRALPLYCRLSSILSLHCCHDLPSPLVCIQWTNAKPSMIQTRASETQIRTQASHLHFSKYRVPTLVRKWVITCFRVCVILSYLHVRSVITCLNHSHCVCWVNNKIDGSFFSFPCDKWKTSRTFDLPACVFLSIQRVVALGSICFWMALPCKCILLTKVIRADQADINTKDLGDCFGVQVGMVWCLGIKKTRELGLHY